MYIYENKLYNHGTSTIQDLEAYNTLLQKLFKNLINEVTCVALIGSELLSHRFCPCIPHVAIIIVKLG